MRRSQPGGRQSLQAATETRSAPTIKSRKSPCPFVLKSHLIFRREQRKAGRADIFFNFQVTVFHKFLCVVDSPLERNASVISQPNQVRSQKKSQKSLLSRLTRLPYFPLASNVLVALQIQPFFLWFLFLSVQFYSHVDTKTAT